MNKKLTQETKEHFGNLFTLLFVSQCVLTAILGLFQRGGGGPGNTFFRFLSLPFSPSRVLPSTSFFVPPEKVGRTLARYKSV